VPAERVLGVGRRGMAVLRGRGWGCGNPIAGLCGEA
jgi:hypothetical protein